MHAGSETTAPSMRTGSRTSLEIPMPSRPVPVPSTGPFAWRALVALPFALAILAPTIARADQCAINDQAIADKAVELAKKSTAVLELCEPCGEKHPQGPYPVGVVDSANGRVTFDGNLRDLAYIYILVGKHTYGNLGLLAGCKAESVSKELVDSRPVRTRPPRPQPSQGGSWVGRPPGPPPLPPGGSRTRVTKPDDLAGTWTVTVRPSLSTCKQAAKNATETWSITVDNGADVTVNQGNGADDFAGTRGSLDRGFYQPTLATKNRPSANVLQLTQYFKDLFHGKITRAESSGIKGDPACLTVVDVSGKRVP
jgi:hypothetical protein